MSHASLYGRPGGLYSVAAVADDSVDRITADAKLNANAIVGEAPSRLEGGLSDTC